MGTRSLFMVGSFEMLLTTQNIFFIIIISICVLFVQLGVI